MREDPLTGLGNERISELGEELRKHTTDEQAKALRQFAQLYFSTAIRGELEGRKLSDLYGATLSCWGFIQQHYTLEPKIRVFNPDFEQHGWQSTHTIIEILYQDLAFLVDSIRMLLNQRGFGIHAIHYAVLNVERDERHRIVNQHDFLEPSDKTQRESIIYVEIDKLDGEEELAQLKTQLLVALKDIAQVGSDFKAMVQRSSDLSENLHLLPAPEQERGQLLEVVEFLQWLANENFTFLGYEEYEVVKMDGGFDTPLRLPDSGLGIRNPKCDWSLNEQNQDFSEIKSYLLRPELLTFFKSPRKSRVHRPAYSDYVALKRFDEEGNVIGGYCFIGLYTSSVYTESPHRIPVIQQKISYVIDRCGFDDHSHIGKELLRILAVHPRDELFHASPDNLFEISLGILNLQERRQVRSFIRQDPESLFFHCFVYTPRDLYNTDSRIRVEKEILKFIPAKEVEFTTYFSESVLCRTHFIARLKHPLETPVDGKQLEQKVVDAARTWEDGLFSTLQEANGEAIGSRYWQKYQGAFSASYREGFSPQSAVADIHHLEKLSNNERIVMSFYRGVEEPDNVVSFKLFNQSGSLPLSDIIPVLENLGLRVIGEYSYEVTPKEDGGYYIQDFNLRPKLNDTIDIQSVRSIFQEAFEAIWYGAAENDSFNELVLSANLHWREIALLRALSSYFKQIRFNFSQSYIANTLVKNQNITLLLIELFKKKFDPQQHGQKNIDAALEKLSEKFLKALEAVDNLSEDLILRRFFETINAILRCNFYQEDDGQLKRYFSFKLNPRLISNMPKPRPMFEIYVYSPDFEGVHLRGGKVARGGLRWSDRLEDFRTEILGLVKAQQVKNAVIVPVGAKGGFVAKNIPLKASREEAQEIGIQCYRDFIGGLLDLTDNLAEGCVVNPPQVVRYDGDDPYLVVAADKGTATFSDIANEIALQRGFWLGDAFASGGSVGYDHKKMGITARGAWVSVQRHFREKGIDVQKTKFTCIGIGDMSGDVFGNGMLQSDFTQLVAAFNHLHIFIDPNPDTKKSYQERMRLFRMNRSSWEDYDRSLLSKGGGIFSRSAKYIRLTEEIKNRFSIHVDVLSPNELISELLKSPVDLIWNGGIGTYVKASFESHSQVGDKSNDVLRINGNELRAKVVGEGGNLGLTQLARIEYSLAGGASYTDFIDNAGGVDCSDHEVNIKILLNEIVANGDLTVKQRNKLLLSMTNEVAELVLNNNYRQTQSISFSETQALDRFEEYRQIILQLESSGKLDRHLEFLPDEEALKDRHSKQQGLTRPEISVLVSYLKADLKEALNVPEITNDKHLIQTIETAFPKPLLNQFKEQVYQHRLKEEIVATQLANDMINRMGIAFIHRLQSSTGISVVDITKGYVVVRDAFQMEKVEQYIESLDYQVSSSTQYRLREEMVHLIRRACRWVLFNIRSELDVSSTVERFSPGITSIQDHISKLLVGDARANWLARKNSLSREGVPELHLDQLSAFVNMYPALGIVEAAQKTELSVLLVAKIYYAVGDKLGLGWFIQQINKLSVSTHWQMLARETLRDDMDLQQRTITISVLEMGRDQGMDLLNQNPSLDDEQISAVDTLIDEWLARNERLVKRWQTMMEGLKSAESIEFAMYTVAMRELCDLAKSSEYQ